MTASEKRQAVVDKYRGILGRNLYSQPRRYYCFKKYSDGKYYSDCSSSVALSYKEAGYPIRDKSGNTCPNTVGMYTSPDLKQVNVTIKNGVIQNPGALRVGDLLLFAGSDSSRAYAGYVGHVEMVYKISGSKITICGHGSGTPRTTEMNAYCKSRYAKKTSTKLGHKGLIRVMRRIADDATGGSTGTATGSKPTLRRGDKGADVKAMQNALLAQGYKLPKYGADGDFGAETESALKQFQAAHGLTADGVCGAATWAALDSVSVRKVIVTGKTANDKTVNVRSAPNTSAKIIHVAKVGENYTYGGQTSENGWHLIECNNQTGWISGNYSKLEG